MANPLAKTVRLRQFFSSHSFRFLPIFLLLFLLLPIFCTTQKTANGAEKELEMDQHELEEGSGDLFNPDDEDDLGGSGMAPPADETDHHHHHNNGRPADSVSLPTSSISIYHSANISARTHPQTFTAPTPNDRPQFAVSPTTPPPISSSVDGTEDEEEGPLREHFHMALLFTLVVLITAVGLGSAALCFCYQRRRRRTTGQNNRSEEYSAGREQTRHYL